MSSNIRVQQICQHCGKEFTARTTTTKCCSDLCSRRAYKLKLRNAKIKQSDKETAAIIHTDAVPLVAREFLTLKDAAKLLQCCTKTISGMIASGRLPAVRLSSRKIYIRRLDIENLFDEERTADISTYPAKDVSLRIRDCYTIGEAQRVSGMSESTLYSYLKRNNIPKIQKG
ncbi:MAG: DNA-binding protein [Sphingobacteriales bacterium]|nr:MAG: DNA-binding protein [Sphingobacteriales bacterium]